MEEFFRQQINLAAIFSRNFLFVFQNNFVRIMFNLLHICSDNRMLYD